MTAQQPSMPPHHQAVLNRFVSVCRADERVVAAFLGGSYAAGTSDTYSDLDLYLISADAVYDEVRDDRPAFVGLLGEPVFLKEYRGHGIDTMLFFLADGTEGELVLGRESRFTHIHSGPMSMLLDKKGILSGAAFPRHQVDQDEQVEMLRDLIVWFWHDLCHHVITPLARGQLWSAYGGLEDLRRTCVNLARLRADFSAEAEGYEKVEQAVANAQLAPLQATCCPLEREAMLQAAIHAARIYRELAPPLAAAHGIDYSSALERIALARLERLSAASAGRED